MWLFSKCFLYIYSLFISYLQPPGESDTSVLVSWVNLVMKREKSIKELGVLILTPYTCIQLYHKALLSWKMICSLIKCSLPLFILFQTTKTFYVNEKSDFKCISRLRYKTQLFSHYRSFSNTWIAVVYKTKYIFN